MIIRILTGYNRISIIIKCNKIKYSFQYYFYMISINIITK